MAAVLHRQSVKINLVPRAFPLKKGKALGTRLSENVQTDKPRRIPNEDLLFVLAAGYHANYCTDKLVPQVHSWWWRLWWVWWWWLWWLWWLCWLWWLWRLWWMRRMILN